MLIIHHRESGAECRISYTSGFPGKGWRASCRRDSHWSVLRCWANIQISPENDFISAIFHSFRFCAGTPENLNSMFTFQRTSFSCWSRNPARDERLARVFEIRLYVLEGNWRRWCTSSALDWMNRNPSFDRKFVDEARIEEFFYFYHPSLFNLFWCEFHVSFVNMQYC